MKIFPRTTRSWLNFLSFTFRSFVVASCFLYLILLQANKPVKWNEELRDNRIILDLDKFPLNLDVLAIICFVEFLVLGLLAALHLIRNSKNAIWDCVFGFIAFVLAIYSFDHPAYK